MMQIVHVADVEIHLALFFNYNYMHKYLINTIIRNAYVRFSLFVIIV
jgi:hypothetical protein